MTSDRVAVRNDLTAEPITPDEMETLARVRKAEAIAKMIGFVNAVLEAHYPDFYWKGFVDVRNAVYDPEWQAFHGEVIREFERRLWFGPFKIERMADVEYENGPNGTTYFSPTYRFRMKLPRKEES
jgi:hypothetical protein